MRRLTAERPAKLDLKRNDPVKTFVFNVFLTLTLTVGVSLPATAGPAPAAVPAPAAQPDTPAAPSGSGLPVPRFVSLKSDSVNLRNGTSTDYPTGWVFRRACLPLEVIKECDAWRQLRYAEGTTGGVLACDCRNRETNSSCNAPLRPT